MKQKLSVRAIIKQGDKVLLLRRSAGNPDMLGKFELPGGPVEPGYDPQVVVEQSLRVQIGIGEPETVQLYDVVNIVDEQVQYLSLVYLVGLAPHDRTIELDQKHDKYQWKELTKIQHGTVTPTSQRALRLGLIPDNTDQGQGELLSEVGKRTTVTFAIIYSDGGSRGNPGPSASGFVILDENEHLIFEGGEYIGITTNNQAEYQAVYYALTKAIELGIRTVEFRMDSMLVVNQLNGIYQIKNRDLWPIYARIKELEEHFSAIRFSHVRRELNGEADAVVNKILDEHSI